MVLDVSYVGNQSRHQLQRVNLNAIPYGATFLPQNRDPTKSAGLPGRQRAGCRVPAPLPGLR